MVGTVLIDLSKAFDLIPHDLVIAEVHTYGFKEHSLVFLYSYLKRRNQNVKLNNTNSDFDILLSGVPLGSVLGPILFNIFMNSLFLLIKNSDLHNFADDKTILSAANDIEEFMKTFLLYERSNRLV